MTSRERARAASSHRAPHLVPWHFGSMDIGKGESRGSRGAGMGGHP